MVQSSRFTSFAELGCLLGLSEILDRLSAFMSFLNHTPSSRHHKLGQMS